MDQVLELLEHTILTVVVLVASLPLYWCLMRDARPRDTRPRDTRDKHGIRLRRPG